jgi:hypothetical protein
LSSDALPPLLALRFETMPKTLRPTPRLCRLASPPDGQFGIFGI